MNKYAQAAITAVKLVESNHVTYPLDAWNIATVALFGKGTPAQKKVCPKGAFIGLCEAGLISGIPHGSFTERSNSQKNKGYAIRSVELLKVNPALVDDKKALWEAVMNGEEKQHNSQMDVAVALWENKLVV
jgi:hypothetical protein